MRVRATAELALAALAANKVRTGLTMLGIIIGVGAVVTMVAVGSGAQTRVEEQIRSLGSNLIIVISGSITASGVRLGTGSHRPGVLWKLRGPGRHSGAIAPQPAAGADGTCPATGRNREDSCVVPPLH